MKLKYRRYPKLVEAMETRHIQYNSALAYIAQKERKGDLLVLRPDSPLPVSRTEKDPDKLRQAYDMGRHTALQRIDDIRSFLSSKG